VEPTGRALPRLQVRFPQEVLMAVRDLEAAAHRGLKGTHLSATNGDGRGDAASMKVLGIEDGAPGATPAQQKFQWWGTK